MIFRHRARFRIRHVNHVVLIDENPAGPAELPPFVDELSVLVEDLNAIITAVAHKEPPLGVKCKRMRNIELAARRTLLPPRHDELAVFGKFHDARVALASVSISHKNVAIRRYGHG